mmetsp:Transcript_29848/g.63372  ORF Transcript_29848/g.63372 Transcript_29848/m.63372 type:complete len:373 (-) Transcript_29848:270-1388(-)
MEEEPRAPSSSDGVDVQLRSLDRHARSRGLEHVLQRPVVPRHIGRSPAHVKSNYRNGFVHHIPSLVQGSSIRGFGVPDDAARRAAQNGLMAPEVVHRSQAPVALHEVQLNVCHETVVEALRESRQVFRDFGRQVRRGAGGVAPRHQLDHAHHLVRQADFREAPHGSRDVTDQFLVLRVDVRMEEDNGKGLDPLVGQLLKRGADGVGVRTAQRNNLFARYAHDALPDPRLRPFGPAIVVRIAFCWLFFLQSCDLLFALVLVEKFRQHHSLVDLDHVLVQYFRRLTRQIEYVGSSLIPDSQQIPEALGDDESHPLPLPFQQCVRRDRRAHSYAPDRRRVHRLSARMPTLARRIVLVQETTYAFGGSVVVVRGID